MFVSASNGLQPAQEALFLKAYGFNGDDAALARALFLFKLRRFGRLIGFFILSMASHKDKGTEAPPMHRFATDFYKKNLRALLAAAPAPLPAVESKNGGGGESKQVQERKQAARATVFVVFLSHYGHVAALAGAIKQGLEAAGVECKLCRVAETLDQNMLEKMKAVPAKADLPVITAKCARLQILPFARSIVFTYRDLPAADGLLFGMPTRYGSMPPQMQALFHATTSLWDKVIRCTFKSVACRASSCSCLMPN